MRQESCQKWIRGFKVVMSGSGSLVVTWSASKRRRPFYQESDSYVLEGAGNIFLGNVVMAPARGSVLSSSSGQPADYPGGKNGAAFHRPARRTEVWIQVAPLLAGTAETTAVTFALWQLKRHTVS